jgi:hypothetical protein
MLAWALLGPAAAQEGPPPMRGELPAVRSERHVVELRNGLAVLVEHRPDSETIRIATRIEGGRAAEASPGASSMAVQLWHTSVPPGGSRDVWGTYELLGARTRVELSADATVYTAEAPAVMADDLLSLETHRGGNPMGWMGEVDEDVRWVAPRHPWRLHRPAILGPVFSALYPSDHPYHQAWSAEGDDLGMIDAAEYVARSYRPENTTVVVSSPLTPREVVCALGDVADCMGFLIYGTGPITDAVVQTTLDRPTPDESALVTLLSTPPPLPSQHYVEVEGAGVGPMLVFAWSAPGRELRVGAVSVRGALDAVVEHIERSLRRRYARDHTVGRLGCYLLDGAVHTSVLCALRLTEPLGRRRRPFRAPRIKAQGLAAELAEWRLSERVGMIQAEEDERRLVDLAEHYSVTGSATPLSDRMESVAVVGPDSASRLLKDAFDRDRTVVVYLLP